MAEIYFLPVCTNCRTILDDQYISVEEEITKIPVQEQVFGLKRCYIHPIMCPECHEPFTAISMPSKLPFAPMRRIEDRT